MNITNNQIKLINSLHSKKGRKENNLFLVEGEKGIMELLDSDFKIEFLVCLEESSISVSNIDIFYVNQTILNKLSTFENNSFGLAIVQKKTSNLSTGWQVDGIKILLDGIRDPGNLGTIIRLADWYGIKDIIASKDSAELYNPKVISATMGSFLRINYWETDLEEFIRSNPQIPSIGAFLEGENVHNFSFPQNGMIIIGNESQGIRKNLQELIQFKITIPKFGEAESLNAAISTGIILDNLTRNLSH